MDHTNTEMIEDLKAVKQFFDETQGGAPVCLEYAIKQLQERSGFWIWKQQGRGGYFVCSKCGAMANYAKNYCYECGRKMEVG